MSYEKSGTSEGSTLLLCTDVCSFFVVYFILFGNEILEFSSLRHNIDALWSPGRTDGISQPTLVSSHSK